VNHATFFENLKLLQQDIKSNVSQSKRDISSQLTDDTDTV